MRFFFFDFFRKSAAELSTNRLQWHLLLKEHAIFVSKLCARFIRDVKEGFSAGEYDILMEILKYSELHNDTPTVLAFCSLMSYDLRQKLFSVCCRVRNTTRNAVLSNIEQFLSFPAMESFDRNGCLG